MSEINIQSLLLQVEKVFGNHPNSPIDFENLHNDILIHTHHNISAQTLKRYFGYLKTNSNPRLCILDFLSQYVGYDNYESFLQRIQDVTPQSYFVSNKTLHTSSLNIGDCIELKWKPDRVCTVHYEGDYNFTVTNPLNSKLSIGDTFQCKLFIQREPLFLDKLCHGDRKDATFEIGRIDGITFFLLPKK